LAGDICLVTLLLAKHRRHEIIERYPLFVGLWLRGFEAQHATACANWNANTKRIALGYGNSICKFACFSAVENTPC
jgi:hypothetical protein